MTNEGQDLLNTVRRMHYAKYKNYYSNCKTVKNSYDPATKTIEVYVNSMPEKSEEEAWKEFAAFDETKLPF